MLRVAPWSSADQTDTRIFQSRDLYAKILQRTFLQMPVDMAAMYKLCKIFGFHGGDYKNVVFLYINTKFIPQRKHYVSVTESIRLMLCKTSGFQSGGYE
jgi:hypothetical protein